MSLTAKRRTRRTLLCLLGLVITLTSVVITPQLALGADALRVSGTFATHTVITSQANSIQPVGFAADVPYRFTPKCSSGACSVDFVRTTSKGVTHAYVLTLGADGSYSGTATYLSECYDLQTGGLLASDAYATTEVATLHPTGAGGIANSFDGQVTITFAPTPVGSQAGCKPGNQTIEASGVNDNPETLPPPVTTPPPPVTKTQTVPEVTAVRFLQKISAASCVGDLARAGFPAAPAMCGFLANSANLFPPNSLAGASLRQFIASKEYRGYVHLPRYLVTCTNGVISSVTPSSTSEPFSWGLGYTPIHGPGGRTYYSLAEPYLANNNFNRTVPDQFFSSDRRSVQVVYQSASRLAITERAANYALSGYDAPFIWTDVVEDINCNGAITLTVGNSNVPSTDIYIDGREVNHTKQADNLSAFLKQGGRVFRPTGYGNLAVPCNVKSFDVAGRLTSSFTGCSSSTFSGFGGGSSGGGGASGNW